MHIEIIKREYSVRKPTFLEKLFSRKGNKPVDVITLVNEERSIYLCDEYHIVSPLYWAFLWAFELSGAHRTSEIRNICFSAYHTLLNGKQISIKSEFDNSKRVLIIRRIQ